MLRFALAQLNSHVGNLDKNTKLAINACYEAYNNQAKIIIFPELFLVGYLPQDLFFHFDFLQQADVYLEQLIQQTKNLDIYIIIGHPRWQDNGLFNSAFIIYKGDKINYYDKQHLPNYGVFDEKRYFTAGKNSCVFNIENTSLEIIICEDIWHNKIDNNVDISICINASPFTFNKHKLRTQQVSKHKQNTIYINSVGAQDEIVFDGNSFITHKNSPIIYNLDSFKEQIAYIDFCPLSKTWINVNNLLIDKDKNEQNNYFENIYSALVLAVHDYVYKNGFNKVVIGLSGGVDSALVACIAKNALGSSNVHTLMMPSIYTADISILDAKQLADNLEISHEVIEIKEIFNSFTSTLKFSWGDAKSNIDVTLENLQARIRGMLLMAYSNKNNALVLTTGNKSEMAVGYCTLYGDMAGAFAVIKDLTKTQVYALCEYYNQCFNNVIPKRILTRAPSAELRYNQTDQDSLPDYASLDIILYEYIENKLSNEQISRQHNLDLNIVNKIIRLIKLNEYKRSQAPIGPKLSNCAFGKDWRYTITNGF